jgi:hypothetical protein
VRSALTPEEEDHFVEREAQPFRTGQGERIGVLGAPGICLGLASSSGAAGTASALASRADITLRRLKNWAPSSPRDRRGRCRGLGLGVRLSALGLRQFAPVPRRARTLSQFEPVAL